MDNADSKPARSFSKIDFSGLMDLRVDYAFKRTFSSGDPLFLISLLNSIFANKKIPRIIKSLAILNPYLEKHSEADKLSILDIRAQLCDGTAVLVEMHLYGLGDLKYKTIRSWARAYSEEIREGESYSTQPPVVCVAFVNGSLDGSESQKIHKCCKIMDIDDHTVFTDALELHYIDMKAFVRTINEAGGIGKGEIKEAMLAKWLAVITEKDIKDKSIIESICVEEEEIGMVVSELVKLSEDRVIRQAYQRRQDDILLYNKRISDYERTIEQAGRIIEQEKLKAEQEKRKAEQAEAALVDKDAIIAELRSRLGEL